MQLFYWKHHTFIDIIVKIASRGPYVSKFKSAYILEWMEYLLIKCMQCNTT